MKIASFRRSITAVGLSLLAAAAATSAWSAERGPLRRTPSVQPADASGGALPAPLMSAPVPRYDTPAPLAEAPPQPVYYDPLPPAVYVAPLIGFGFGYYGGYHGGYRGHGVRR